MELLFDPCDPCENSGKNLEEKTEEIKESIFEKTARLKFEAAAGYFKEKRERESMYGKLVKTCYGYKVELPTRYTEETRRAFRYNDDPKGMITLECRYPGRTYGYIQSINTHEYKFTKSKRKWIEHGKKEYPDYFEPGDPEYSAFEKLLKASSNKKRKKR